MNPVYNTSCTDNPQNTGHNSRTNSYHSNLTNKNLINLFSQIQTGVHLTLVVPASGGVQFLTHIADQLDQTALDTHMNILILHIKYDLSISNILADCFQTRDDLVFLLIGNDALLAQLTMMENRLKNLEDSNATRMDSVRGALVQGLNTIRADNNKKLDEIRGTVEEKLQDTLQQRINDSFKTVSAQLEQVYKGLGEMQNLAADVGSLKQVLSGVKTRGILGEVQLGAILEQILAPGQYEENVATVPGSTNRVEFAVKLPGQGGPVWLPIDAKFPGDTYAHLQAAQQRGDAAAVNAMRKALNNVLRAEAKDIHDKYIEVPYTTSFGILFLPFEGLYAEVVSSGVTELLQREYQITVAGPSTMAALLNALQMGFRTLAIQKRSGEVWTILGAVKTEFEKFGTGLQQMQRHLNQTGSDLEELIGPRSRAITRKLESVQQLDPDAAAELLGIEK